MARFEVEGRSALVTGGSAGIGLALVRQLLRGRAACVVVVARDRARLAAVEAEAAGRVVPLQADLADACDVDRLLDTLPRLVPELSLVFNNAATQQPCDFVHGDPRTRLPDLRREIATNLSAIVALAAGLLPILSRQPTAAMVNVTSALALAPKRSAPVYCATKAAVRSLTRSLRDQCERSAPHVRLVEALPPLVETAMTRGHDGGKISADACAAAILAGLRAGREEIHVGKAAWLRVVMRVSPALGHAIMRDA